MKKIAFVFLVRLYSLAEVSEVSSSVQAQQLNLLEAQSEDGTALWERTLHQKSTQTEMFLFGSKSKISIGETKFTSSGEFDFKNGALKISNGIPRSGTLTFNYTNFKINTDRAKKSDDVLVADPISPMVLKIISIETLENQHFATCKLTVKGTTKLYIIPISFEKESTNRYRLKARFVIQTLDFPIRRASDKSEVVKDEIEVDLNVSFH